MGKIVSLANNDIYSKNKDRNVIVFICFKEKKYMNNYIVYCYEDEINGNNIYYGSLHLKDTSLVCFSTNDDKVEKYVEEAIKNIIDSKKDNDKYEIIDISKMEKIEIVSQNKMEYNNINTIKDKTIKKEISKEVKKENKKKDYFLLYLFLIVVIILIDCMYLYFNSGLITRKYKYMDCAMTKYDEKIKIDYIENRIIKFDKKNKVKDIEIILDYEFKDYKYYYQFKENNKQYDYFLEKGTYKYNDDNLELKIFYKDESIITDYEEMKNYLKHEGYDCTYGEYEE